MVFVVVKYETFLFYDNANVQTKKARLLLRSAAITGSLHTYTVKHCASMFEMMPRFNIIFFVAFSSVKLYWNLQNDEIEYLTGKSCYEIDCGIYLSVYKISLEALYLQKS